MNESAERPFVLLRLWRRHPRLYGWLVALLAVLLALYLFLVFALPGIVVTQAERAVAQQLHRRLVIDRVRIRPLALAASVEGLRLMEPDGSTVFAAFERLDLRLSAASLLRLAPVVRELHLAAPYVHWVRTAPNHFNTDDLVAALQAGPPAPAPAAPPRFAVNNIVVERGRFDFDDQPVHARHSVTDLFLGIPYIASFASDEEVYVQPALSALVDGAPLKLQGRALPFAPTREAVLDLDFDDIDLDRYAGYVPAELPYGVRGTRLDMHLVASVQQPKDGPPRLALSGMLVLRKLDLRDASGRRVLALDELALDLRQARLPSGRLDAALVFNRKGRVTLAGDTALAPLHLDLAVGVEQLDLQPFAALVSDRINVRVTRAVLSGKARLALDQPADGPDKPMKGEVRADLALARLATLDVVNANDFVDWDDLALRGLRVQLAPLAVHVDEVALKNFYARVIVSPAGRINLQDIMRGRAQPQRSLTDATAAAPAAAPPPAAAPAPKAGAGTAAAALPPVSIGKVVLAGGHVRFTDNFIKPRYTADLLDLHGAVAGISSDPKASASVDLQGRVNDAPLVIGGTISPLRAEPALDIKASVHGMELAQFTPYSSKYVGYRIERGKMSFDVAYRLENRQLSATNRLVLDQLTFGERVESPSATSLPVMLAVALLKDRNGVIDIDLPIGGSLDDPQFSVGGLLVKVLVNLITKAVTAPFTLLANLVGGGSSAELSWVAFAPGQWSIGPDGEAKLKSLAKALAERPGLKLEVQGWADPQADGAALRRAALASRLRALKRQEMAASGTLVTGAEVAVSAHEYTDLLARAYQLDIAGSAKGARPNEQQMEKALLERQPVGDDELRALGDRRAQAAKSWLTTVGSVPEERVALVGAKIGAAPAASAGAPSGQGKAPEPPARVEFSLR